MKRTAFQLIGILAVALVLGVRTPAVAQEAKPVLLVLFADADKLSDSEKAALNTEQKKVLEKYGKYSSPDTPKIDFLDEMVNYECLEMDAACLAQIGKANNAAFVLYTSFDGAKFAMKLVNQAEGKVVGEKSGSATKKNIQGEAGKDAIVGILGPIPEPKKEVPPELVTVNISSNVEAAEVFINQKRVGVTPLKVKLKEGKYTISVRKQDFLMSEETVNVAGAEPMDWVATLKPVPVKTEKKVVVTPPPPKDKTKEEEKAFYQTWWFWTAVGVGAAAAVGGTVAALSSGGDTFEVGTVKFTVNPSLAERDYLFYEPTE